MADLARTVSCAAGLYARRLGFAFQGYVRRDPMSLLHLRPGRDDPYRVSGIVRGPIRLPAS